MSRRSESTLTSKIVQMIRAHGHWATKIHGGAYQRSGLPDICAVVRGRAVWIEVKIPGELPTALQQICMDDLRAHDAAVAWCNNLESAKEFIQQLDRRTRPRT